MSEHPDGNGGATPKRAGGRIWVSARFALGYILAIAVGSVVFAELLQFVPDFSASHLPNGGTTVLRDRIFQLTMLCFYLGGIFALPYTILASLAFWFLLPRKIWIFLLIGTFCPIAALMTMGLFLGGAFWWDAPFMLHTLPAGLIAAYAYGALGFGQGLWRWRFE